jgi:hypothetical protein
LAQLFHPVTNVLAKATVFGFVLALAFIAWVVGLAWRSAYATGVEIAREQPVPFSHAHHVSGLGIDCRYCHAGVETSSVAGLPPTRTCMNCHAEVWAEAPMLAPVRESWRDGRPLAWNRVHDLADFVYFDHSIHVAKGVGCVTCHGNVDDMPLVWKTSTLYMEWCLSCHRAPELHLRPREALFSSDTRPPDPRLARDYGVKSRTDCVTCHR